MAKYVNVNSSSSVSLRSMRIEDGRHFTPLTMPWNRAAYVLPRPQAPRISRDYGVCEDDERHVLTPDFETFFLFFAATWAGFFFVTDDEIGRST